MKAQTLRSKRLAAGIPAEVVAIRAGIDRAKLSRIERARASASPDELRRVETAINELEEAMRQVESYAASVGWPVAVFG